MGSTSFDVFDLGFPVASAGSVCVGIVFLWANARRPLNVAAAICCLFIAALVGSFYLAEHPPFNPQSRVWLQTALAVSPWSVVVAWMLKRASTHPTTFYRDILRHAAGLILIVVAMCLWCYGDSIIPPGSKPGAPGENGALLAFYLLLGSLAAIILAQTTLELRRIEGIQRIELTILVVGGTLTIVSAAGFGFIGRHFGNLWCLRLSPISATVFVGVMLWGVTQKRILDARQVLFTTVAYGALFTVALFLVVGSTKIAGVPLVVAVAGGSLVAFVVVAAGQRWIETRFNHTPRERDLHARKQMTELTKTLDTKTILERGKMILCEWAGASACNIIELDSRGATPDSSRSDFDEILKFLERNSRWASAASIQRSRDSEENRKALDFLRVNSFGLIATSSTPLGEGQVVICLSDRRNRKPYTFSDAVALADCCDIFSVALSRAHLSTRAINNERLAISGMINAGFSHEMKNSLYSMKMLCDHVSRGETGREGLQQIAAATSRQIQRLEKLVTQTLSVVNPNNAVRTVLDANGSVENSVRSVKDKADKAGVRLATNLLPDGAWVVADPALENCIVNLLLNAVEATSESDNTEKTVTVTTRRVGSRVELIVADNGPGISPVIRGRLFEAFATGKMGGTGLGLMFSRKIIESNGGELTLEPDGPPGATFAIRLPAAPPA